MNPTLLEEWHENMVLYLTGNTLMVWVTGERRQTRTYCLVPHSITYCVWSTRVGHNTWILAVAIVAGLVIGTLLITSALWLQDWWGRSECGCCWRMALDKWVACISWYTITPWCMASNCTHSINTTLCCLAWVLALLMKASQMVRTIIINNAFRTNCWLKRRRRRVRKTTGDVWITYVSWRTVAARAVILSGAYGLRGTWVID